MRLIDQIVIPHQGVDRAIKLFVGDLSAIPENEAVDLLIVSAFPNDYIPTRSSLIGALHRRGISVETLSRAKAVDLRQFSSCWLSQEVTGPPSGFQRILCFEPATRGRAPEVVGDIFRSLIPFTGGTPPIRQIAMPIVAAGDQGESESVMLEAIVEAAAHWLSIGLPLECIKIVTYDAARESSLRDVFVQMKSKLGAVSGDSAAASPWRFDLFVSYSHQNTEEVKRLVSAIRDTRPSLRIFLDRLELHPGAAWQQHLFEAIDESRKVVAVFSPHYLASKVCLEEYNIAHFRHRDSPEGVLRPVYLHSASLPTYMKLVQFIDAREGESSRLSEAAAQLVTTL